MVVDWIIAGGTVLVVAARPRSWRATAVAVAIAASGVALGHGSAVGTAVHAVAPMAGLLAVALALSGLAVRLGAARRAAARLAVLSRGSGSRLFVLVCTGTALLTAVVTLDGAVVVMAPVLVELHRRYGAPLRPLVLGTVAVANAFSLALPEGNPTNLVVIERLGLSVGQEARTMLLPGLAATVVCAALIARRERRVLGASFAAGSAGSGALPGEPGLMGVPLVIVQILALLVALLPLGHPSFGGAGLPGLLAVSLVVSALAALANNLPASAIVAAGLSSGPAAYAALVGLSVGALAVPRGSVATAIAGELTGEQPPARVLAPTALAAALAATIVVWLVSIS